MYTFFFSPDQLFFFPDQLHESSAARAAVTSPAPPLSSSRVRQPTTPPAELATASYLFAAPICTQAQFRRAAGMSLSDDDEEEEVCPAFPCSPQRPLRACSFLSSCSLSATSMTHAALCHAGVASGCPACRRVDGEERPIRDCQRPCLQGWRPGERALPSGRHLLRRTNRGLLSVNEGWRQRSTHLGRHPLGHRRHHFQGEG